MLNREILFRAKKKNENIWIYGDLIRVVKNNKRIVPCILSTGDELPSKVQESTFGQYTGYQDKNSICIFEGDILKNGLSNTNDLFVVSYENGGFVLLDVYKFPTIIDAMRSDTVEVVGNIYDNADMLSKNTENTQNNWLQELKEKKTKLK